MNAVMQTMEVATAAASSGALRWWAFSHGVQAVRPVANHALLQAPAGWSRRMIPQPSAGVGASYLGSNSDSRKKLLIDKDRSGRQTLTPVSPSVCALPGSSCCKPCSGIRKPRFSYNRPVFQLHHHFNKLVLPFWSLGHNNRPSRVRCYSLRVEINSSQHITLDKDSGDPAKKLDGSKKPQDTATERASSVYIHIPFCKRRCFYCDFPIQVVGSRPESGTVIDGMESYVDTLCQEIDVAVAAADHPSHEPLRTVFFGGGTPSLLPPNLLVRLLDKLNERFGIQSGAEIAMEMDPGTFGEPKLRAFMAAGVNRLSMGVQGFQDDLLKACGRSHGLADVHSAIETVHKVGISNWSLDLISSLPHQTPELWQHSLDQAVQAGPSHVSVYDLQIEEGTAFGRWFKPGEGPLPGDDAAADMYRQAVTTLTAAGYGHYEVSNYAKPGYECRHNLVYWKGAPYFAFGLGAASYTNRQRFTRPRKMADYVKWVEQYAASGGVIDGPQDGEEDRLLDRLMLRLRLAEGLDLKELTTDFGEETVLAICKALTPFVESGHVLVSDRVRTSGILAPSIAGVGIGEEWTNVYGESPQAKIRLSDPDGFLVSNEILSTLFSLIPNSS